MPRFVFGFGNFWQDFKDMIDGAWTLWLDPKEAPPVMRKIDVAYVPMRDAKGNIFVFVPEFYELARVNGLKAQEDATRTNNGNPRLLRTDGSKKSHFELATLPIPYSDFNAKASRDVYKAIQKEMDFRVKSGKPLPPTVCKYQIVSDYLENLGDIGMKPIRGQQEGSGQRDQTINLQNPALLTSKVNRWAHYIAQRCSLILTLFAVLGLPWTSPLAFATSAIGVMLAKWCAEEFNTFGLAEFLQREIHSNFSKEFLIGNADAINLKKTIKTAILLTAMVVTAVCVFSTTWTGVLSWSMWKTASSIIANADVLAAVQLVLAGFASTIAFIGAFSTSGYAAQRFFWGLGIRDKQIDFSSNSGVRAPEPQLPEYIAAKELAKADKHAKKAAKFFPDEKGAQILQATRIFTQFQRTHPISSKSASTSEEVENGVTTRSCTL